MDLSLTVSAMFLANCMFAGWFWCVWQISKKESAAPWYCYIFFVMLPTSAVMNIYFNGGL